VPVLFDYCLRTYKAMMAEATWHDMDGVTQSVVYEGHFTRLITVDLNLSTPYYTFVTRALKAMGCIRQLRRGGGSTPSQWELIREPTPELFNESGINKHIRLPKYATREELAAIQQQLSDQSKTIMSLQSDFKKILEGLS
jgi:hypothetical protein